MKRLRVTDFGPIREADVKFGDLTVLVGPQASGKSLFVQLYKLIEDAPAIAAELERYGFDWRDTEDPVQAFSSLYFGGGLEGIFGKTTKVLRDSRRVEPLRLAKTQSAPTPEAVFLIPAQRVLVLQDGWPKPFMSYGVGDPYSIRKFSEVIRRLTEGLRLFKLNELIPFRELQEVVNAAIYSGSILEVKREEMRRQVVLRPFGNSKGLPYSVWSAGQREFTPLLLGWSAVGFLPELREGTNVIIEEPEMGLHPQAIIALWLLILELLTLGGRVVVSTHSPVVLDLIWALRELSTVEPDIAVDALCKIFQLEKPSNEVRELLADVLKKTYRTYFFNRTDSGVITQDISSLDPGSEDENIAGWGGLSGFSGRIARIVGEASSR
jgi:hypothetical protein